MDVEYVPYGLSQMKDLIGDTVNRVFVEESEYNMFFVTKSGAIWQLSVSGDCCSESWFSDFYNVEALLHGTITKINESGMPDYNVDDGRGRQESDQVYGYEFVTTKGTATLVFRNSSNGYYGGSMGPQKVGTLPHKGLKEITADWSA
jgi:hypothetical protein